jgi:putative oxygen-independent coproporphyrinogen III oxidase
MIPLSLYIHLPWCVRKCPYCDFNSHEFKDNIPEQAYVAALIKDLDERLPSVVGRDLTSIFFGGGTPSLFSPQAILAVLNAVEHRLPISTETEITLEANPGTIDEKRFKGFRQAGVNRLSLGIQSLQDTKLKALGRIHNRDYALRAIELAIDAGFDNFNLDIMHGLPEQSMQDAIGDLRDCLNFAPPHLSWYQLTIEPNTFFHHKPPTLPCDETLWDIQEEGKTVLAAAGLLPYEVSAYAKPGHECAHNKNYWEFGDYLGIGAGAHSKITDMDSHAITRHWQVKNPNDYLNQTKKMTANSTILEPNDIIFEFMLNALRLTHGVSTSLFTERTGLPINTIEAQLLEAKQKKLLIDHPSRIEATELGMRFLNNTIDIFLPNKNGKAVLVESVMDPVTSAAN